MALYKINGSKELAGTVKIGGSKNAALPCICATLLTDQQCVLTNVPDISDVRNLLKILEDLGSKYDFQNNILKIDNSGVNSYSPKQELVKKLRGSILLLGPLLKRFGKVEMPFPGGDSIGRRPIDTHLLTLSELGAQIQENQDYLHISGSRLIGRDIILNELSVTATENLIMATVCAEGKTSIHLSATEPHVQNLCAMLNGMGAKISNIGSHDLQIEGVQELRGVEHAIIFDNEVACSFMNLAAATKSEIRIENIQSRFLYAPRILLQQMKVNFEIGEDFVLIKKPNQQYAAAKIKANIYPGLLSDYIPPFSVLATQAEGRSIIHEWMYEGRLGYIHELAKMGAKARILDQHYAEIEGPTPLQGTNVSSLDLRGGMVMIIAALVASGKSVLHDVEHVERGYENIQGILQSLGADITREEE